MAESQIPSFDFVAFNTVVDSSPDDVTVAVSSAVSSSDADVAVSASIDFDGSHAKSPSSSAVGVGRHISAVGSSDHSYSSSIDFDSSNVHFVGSQANIPVLDYAAGHPISSFNHVAVAVSSADTVAVSSSVAAGRPIYPLNHDVAVAVSSANAVAVCHSGSSSFTTNSHFKMGDKFPDYDSLAAKTSQFERDTCNQLWHRDTRTIEAAYKKGIKRSINPNLKYYSMKFTCCHGGKEFNSRSSG